VVDEMYDNRHSLEKLFSKVEDLNNQITLNYANQVFQKYHNIEPYDLFQKAQNKP